jgi:hypothetical protein
MLFLLSLAAMGPWCVAVALVVLLGWRATSNLVYSEQPAAASSPGLPLLRHRLLLPAFCLVDRFLAGQILLAWALARGLILLREFLTGLTGVSVSERVPSAAASAAAFSWMSMAMQTVSTATRVQSRLAGHVAREIGHQQRQIASGGGEAAARPGAFFGAQHPLIFGRTATPGSGLSLPPACTPTEASVADPAAAAEALRPRSPQASPWAVEDDGDGSDACSDGCGEEELQRSDTSDLAAREIDAFIGSRRRAGDVRAGGAGGAGVTTVGAASASQ